MRRGQVGILLAVMSGLFFVLLAVAVNVATGGRCRHRSPRSAGSPGRWWGALAVGIGLAIWQQRLAEPPSAVDVRGPAELPAPIRLFGRDEDLALLDGLLRAEAAVVVLAAAPGTDRPRSSCRPHTTPVRGSRTGRCSPGCSVRPPRRCSPAWAGTPSPGSSGDALVGDMSVPRAGSGDNATILKNYRLD